MKERLQKIISASGLMSRRAAEELIAAGKVSVNATPQAARVMCTAIKEFYAKTGRKVGFKAAGGVSNADEALEYYQIGLDILGPEWMNKNLFRFGVSRLGNSLMSAIEGKEIKFF